MKFDLKKPCGDCPFRKDKLFPLRKEKVVDIVNSSSFACHKTLKYEEGDTVVTAQSQSCAGLMIMLEKMGQPNQMMRIAERIGMYDRRTLDMNAPIYNHLSEYLNSLEQFDKSC